MFHLTLYHKLLNLLQGNVVCKQLGYTRAASVFNGSHFGKVDSNFAYDDVSCSGFESNLEDCEHSNTNNCEPGEGAGVICTT